VRAAQHALAQWTQFKLPPVSAPHFSVQIVNTPATTAVVNRNPTTGNAIGGIQLPQSVAAGSDALGDPPDSARYSSMILRCLASIGLSPPASNHPSTTNERIRPAWRTQVTGRRFDSRVPDRGPRYGYTALRQAPGTECVHVCKSGLSLARDKTAALEPQRHLQQTITSLQYTTA
jgi:hypothetical protein